MAGYLAAGGGSRPRGDRSAGISSRAGAHERAVAQTLGRADEAAAGGDYKGALSWLAVIESIGDELPAAYQERRRQWALELSTWTRLDHALDGLVRTAQQTIDARYAALTILDRQRVAVEHFYAVGVDTQTRIAIGHPPNGRGVLGYLMQHPRPLRLSEVSAHPRSYGFPPGHPEMHSFLGVPIMIGRSPSGSLYLADKQTGDFTLADEHAATAMALTAATAVERARSKPQALD